MCYRRHQPHMVATPIRHICTSAHQPEGVHALVLPFLCLSSSCLSGNSPPISMALADNAGGSRAPEQKSTGMYFG